MSFESNDDAINSDDADDDVKRIEALIADPNLSTRADGLAEMATHLRTEPGRTPRDPVPYIEAAIELNEQLDRQVELVGNYWTLSDLQFELRQFEESKESLHKSIALAQANLVESSLPMTMSNLANVYRNLDDHVNAIYWYEQAWQIADQQLLKGMAAAALMRLVSIHFAVRNYHEGVEKAELAFMIFQQLGNNVGLVDAINQQAWGRSFDGTEEFDQVAELLEKSKSLNQLINHSYGEEIALVLEAKLAVDTGKASPATLESLDALLARTRERNDATASAVVNYFRAYYLHWAKRDYQAIEIIQSLLKIDSIVEPRIDREDLLSHLFFCAVGIEDFEMAAKAAIEAADLCEKRGDTEMKHVYWHMTGESYLIAGDPAQAIPYLEKRNLAAGGNNILSDIDPYLALARAYVSVGRNTEALAIANELDARLQAIPASIPEDDPERAQAEYSAEWKAKVHEIKLDALLALGDAEHAAAEADICKQVYENMEDFAAVARVHKAIGSTDSASGRARPVDENQLFRALENQLREPQAEAN